MRFVASFGAAALAIAAATSAAAKTPVPIALEPSSPWQMDYGDSACTLARAFGTGDQKIILKLTRYQPTDYLQLTVYGAQLKSAGRMSKLAVSFGAASPGDANFAVNGMAGTLPMIMGPGYRLAPDTSTDPEAPSPISPATEAAIDGMTFKQDHGPTFALHLQKMGRPMALMRDCTDKLVASWGYDPAQQNARQAPPKPKTSPAYWATSADYPQALLSKNVIGIISFRLEIDPFGKVTGCHILSATKPEGFADLTCRLLLKRARFVPAIGADGAPMASYYVNTVNWLVP